MWQIHYLCAERDRECLSSEVRLVSQQPTVQNVHHVDVT